MAGRPKQVIINDLVNEFDVFGSRVVAIRDAIQTKGVTSEGKFSKFAEEISKIQTTNTAYAGIISYVEEAYKKGYYEYEIIDMLHNLRDRNAPLPTPNPAPGEKFDMENATEIKANQFKNRSDLTGPATFAKVTKVGANAFTGCGYTAVNLPKATEINVDAFAESAIDTLEIQSFVWNRENKLNLQSKDGKKYVVDKIVVHQDSIPPSDLVYEKPEIKIFNPDYSRKWNVYSNRWEESV